MSDDGVWPSDADGDVFRKLWKNGFDFSREYVIDFNVDFEPWPPSVDLTPHIQERFPRAVVEQCNEDGYVLVKIKAKLEYNFVMFVQRILTEIADPHGGYCESWGVMH